MRAAELDMRGRKPGFMLHLRMRGMLRGQPRSVVRTLFLEDTYRATGLCAAIGRALAAEGMEPDVFRRRRCRIRKPSCGIFWRRDM